MKMRIFPIFPTFTGLVGEGGEVGEVDPPVARIHHPQGIPVSP